MWIILDLIIVAIVLLFVFISAKRGFARTIVEFVGYILAVYLAFAVGGIISTAVYDGIYILPNNRKNREKQKVIPLF